MSELKALEQAGQLAASKGVAKEANPYLRRASGVSQPLLDHESRQQLAAAWSKGWERAQQQKR